jgi:hypothetical protein
MTIPIGPIIDNDPGQRPFTVTLTSLCKEITGERRSHSFVPLFSISCDLKSIEECVAVNGVD